LAILTGRRDWQKAAQFFWQTVRDHRTVAIGGNSVKEHFHDDKDFSSMIDEVEGPETCNTYNMLKLSRAAVQLGDAKGSYADYYERALYNHILSSQRPHSGGFVYFTPMRPNHYRVYSQAAARPCGAASAPVSRAMPSTASSFTRIDGDTPVRQPVYPASTLNWREQGVTIRQATRFPDEEGSTITVEGNKTFTLKIRYPEWVEQGRCGFPSTASRSRPAGARPLCQRAPPLARWRPVDIRLPMKTHLEQMPDKSDYYAVLHGPVVLAAKTPVPGREAELLADDSRMGHIASGPVCPLEAAPILRQRQPRFTGASSPSRAAADLHRAGPDPGQGRVATTA
jgi:DUF1680 family protein